MTRAFCLFLSTFLLSTSPVAAQMGGGGMGGGGMGGMGGGGMGGAGPPGGGPGPGGLMRPPSPPKPLSRDRFDKAVTAMFRDADVSRDGMVTIEELRGIVEARRDAIIRARFAKIDSNNDRAISQEEFFGWQRQMGSLAASDKGGLVEREGPVAEVVRPELGDDPQDRAIAALVEPLSVTLLTQANGNYDAGVSLAELIANEGKRFEAADANHDGWLTMEEMRATMPKRGPRPESAPPGCPPGMAC
ncbi:MAG: EF-hand domain-containing protein [Pseudomonadota bacterium]|uniref:EF-hand domain-containing protein n=1 Tax=Sphingobium sp. TaxID=1912891 RepID=UPI002E1EF377